MKDLKLSVKLIGAFLVVALIAGVVGYIGITKLRTINDSYALILKHDAEPITELAQAMINYQKYRADLRDLFLDSPEERSARVNKIKGDDKTINEYLEKFEKTIRREEVRKNFNALKEALDKYEPERDKVIDLVLKDKKDEALKVLRGEALSIAKTIAAAADSLFTLKVDVTKKTSQDNAVTASGAIRFSLIVTIVGVIVAILLGSYLSLSITRPINRIIAGLSDGSEQVASASAQVSSAGQSLAEGASEQAAGLEETSSSPWKRWLP